jgi:hypothetical protein
MLLALLALLITLQRPGWRAAALTGGAVLLAGLSSWYHLFHTGLLFALLFVWRTAAAWRNGGGVAVRQELLPWLRVGAVSGLLLLPFFLPVALEASTAAYARKSAELVFSADVLDLLPVLPGSARHSAALLSQTYGYTFALLPLMLAGIGLALVPRQAAVWAVLAGGCLLLSLGPVLLVGGVNTGVPLPYALFRLLPVADALRAPIRINSVTTILLALIAALGLAHIFERLARRHSWLPSLVASGLVLLIVLEVLRPPFPLVDGRISPVYDQIGSEPGAWSLLELPSGQFDRGLQEMYAQVHHGKYILTGDLSRSVPRLPYEESPLLRQIEQPVLSADIVRMTPREQTQMLRAMRVRYLLIHDTSYTPGQLEQQVTAARAVLGNLSQVYADDELHAYRLDDMAAWLDGVGRSERVAMPLFLGLDRQSAWYQPEMTRAGWGRWLPPEGGGFSFYTPRARRAVLEVWLDSLPGARPLELWLNGRHVQTLPIVGDGLRRYLSTPLELPAGPGLLELRAPAGGVSPRALGLSEDTRLLSFSVHFAKLHEVQP